MADTRAGRGHIGVPCPGRWARCLRSGSLISKAKASLLCPCRHDCRFGLQHAPRGAHPAPPCRQAGWRGSRGALCLPRRKCAACRAGLEVCVHADGSLTPRARQEADGPVPQGPGSRQRLGSPRPCCKPRGSSGLVGVTVLLLAGEEDGRDQSRLETKVWEAHNPLIDKQIDQFLVVAR